MLPEITLNIYDETGRERQSRFSTSRLTIGRLLENDLVVEDANLSLRHAVIENLGGRVLISDCGTENGTHVNGVAVVRPVELRDGDVITLGGSTEIVVQFDEESPSHIAPALRAPQKRFRLKFRLVGAALSVLLLAGLLVTVFMWGNRAERSDAHEDEGATAVSQPSVASASDSGARAGADGTDKRASGAGSEESARDVGGDESTSRAFNDDEIEKYALKVLRDISDDPNPTLSREAVRRIDEKVKSYRGSASLRDMLRTLGQRGTLPLAGAAKRNNIKLPLVVYAALARIERDGAGGDPTETAQAMLPALARLRGIFSTELANDSLLVVAAYDEGQAGSTHPLQTRIFELARTRPDSPATIRTVWYLHEQHKLGAQSFDFVLRFIAVGVIAQHPRRFGVDADPLALQNYSGTNIK